MRLGVPVAIQGSIVNISSLFVQSYIAGTNGDQTAILGGYATFTRIISILCQPAMVMVGTTAVFVAQSIGAGDTARARQGVRWAILIGLAGMVPICLATTLLADYIPYVFTSDESVVAMASKLFAFLTLFYLIEPIAYPMVGALRGLGKTTTVLVVTLATQIGARQIYLFVVANYISNEYIPVVFSIPFGLLLYCAAVIFLYLRSARRGLGPA